MCTATRTTWSFTDGKFQKLQREIANYRGTPYDHSIGSPALDTVSDTGRAADSPSSPADVPESGTHGGSETKRKYRRHPKPDENAPSRAPSAYVLFSNKIREDVRGQNMSFTDIAKLVGDRWQKLAPIEKQQYETLATTAKEKYNAELAEYKKTESYRDYTRYLVEFKVKHGGSTVDSKRPKLGNESSNGSLSEESAKAAEISTIPSSHVRVGSMGTVDSTASQSDLGSPIPLAPYPRQGLSTRLPPISPSTDTIALLSSHEQRQYITFSSQSSVSDESPALRDYPDPLSHAAQLSLLPGAGRMAENSTQLPTSSEYARMPAANRRPVRARTPIGACPSASDSTSRSSASSRSNNNSSEASFPFATSSSSVDESWPTQSSDPGYPALSKSMSVPIGAATLPPLLASENMAEVSSDHSQRFLPLPTTSGSPEGYHGLRSLPRLSTMTVPRPQDLSGFGLNSRVSADQKSSLDRSESDAADALADLAFGNRPRNPVAQGGRRLGP